MQFEMQFGNLNPKRCRIIIIIIIIIREQ